MAVVRFAQRQHPVGQGGFHTAELLDANRSYPPLFRWIYDCGSNQTPRLHAEIADVAGGNFDLLFLSHLDADHVYGVDNLLSCASVTEVVLPYLNDLDRTFLLASALSDGSATGSFVAFVQDPAIWFGQRGVARVTFVEGSDDDDDDDGIEPPDPLEPGPIDEKSEEVTEVKFKWSKNPEPVPTSGTPSSVEVATIEVSTVGTLHANGSTLNWILAPFAVRPSTSKMASFQHALDHFFGPGLTAREYAAQARTDGGRGKLRICYDHVLKTQNLHSMALYAGPIDRRTGAIRNTAYSGAFVRRVVDAGWLSTGDFAANVPMRRNKLFAYYGRFSDLIGQLSLPHHGSDLSFDTSLVAFPPNLRAAIAAVGANSYGHPGLAVQAAVHHSGSVSFVRVDETPGSGYEVIGLVK